MEFGEFTVRYWVEFLFGLMTALMSAGFAWIWKRFRQSQREQDCIKNGIKALLRDRIIRAYNRYRDRGFCPIYGLENVHDMYEQYRALGGNGAVTQLVRELEALPKAGAGAPRGEAEAL